jgi:uncharacterized protein (TIGR03067 family)
MSLQLLALTVGLLGAADGPKDEAVQKEMKTLQGTWVIDSAMTKGKGVAVKASDGGDVGGGLGNITMKDGKWTYKLDVPGGLDAHKEDEGQKTFTVDPGKDPKRIEIRSGDKVIRRGVYELKGNRLTVRLSAASEKDPQFPTSLRAEDEGSTITLSLMRRAEKKE